MPYIRVPDPLLNVNKPGRSADWKQIRDNQDYFDAQITAAGLGIRTDQDIREHFMGTSIYADTWTTVVDGGTGTVAITGDHSASFSATAFNDYAILAATTNRMRVIKSGEYVAFCEARVKRTGDVAQAYAFGWNDNGLTANATLVTDRTDFVGVHIDTGATEDWVARTAESAGGASTFTITTTETNWQVIRLEFTCSATSGLRKVEVYLNDVLQTTFATDANIPAEVLRPVIGVASLTAGGNPILLCDRITFGFRNIPVAP